MTEAMPRRFHPATRIAVLCVSLLAGCAGKQQYEFLPFPECDALLSSRTYVLEAHVTGNRSQRRPSAWERLTFFIPRLVVTGDHRNDAFLNVDTVIEGRVPEKTMELRDYRHLTPDELKRLPDGQYGDFLYPGLRVRLAFDGRRGRRFERLQLAPLGNTSEYNAMIKTAGTIR